MTLPPSYSVSAASLPVPCPASVPVPCPASVPVSCPASAASLPPSCPASAASVRASLTAPPSSPARRSVSVGGRTGISSIIYVSLILTFTLLSATPPLIADPIPSPLTAPIDDSSQPVENTASTYQHYAQLATFIDLLGPITYSLLKKPDSTSSRIIDRQYWSSVIALRWERHVQRGGYLVGLFARRFAPNERTNTADFSASGLGMTYKSRTDGQGYGMEFGWTFGPRAAYLPWATSLSLAAERSIVNAKIFHDSANGQSLLETPIKSTIDALYARVRLSYLLSGISPRFELLPGATIPLVAYTEKTSDEVNEVAVRNELNHRILAGISLGLAMGFGF